MFKRLAVGLILLFLFALSASAQTGAAFSISSHETYAPGQKPQVSIWTQHVPSLEFRLYRINDPLRFFAQLQEQHQFGGRAPRIGREETWLEKFHAWKHRVWAWFRDFIRAQFSRESRSNIREWRLEQHVQHVSKVEAYAQVPLLNKQQLAAVWRWTPESGKQSWESQAVTVPATEAGVYLVEATDGTLKAYTVVIISEIAVLTKVSAGQVLSFVVERKSGKPVANADVMLWIDKKDMGRTETDGNGLALLKAKADKPEDASVLVTDGKRFAINAPNGWGLSTDSARRIHSYAYTDRPVYRPGDKVHFKFMLRNRLPEGYQVPTAREVNLELRDDMGNTKLQKKYTVSDMGTFSGDYDLPADSSLGFWYLTAQIGETSLTGATFYVEEYKKPEYQVRVTPQTLRVIQGQPITATIDARYYFGEPVANAKVTWVVHRSTWWVPGRYFDAEDSDEGGGDDIEEGDGEYDYGGEQTDEHTAKLDADGKLQIMVATKPDGDHNDTRYRIEARVTDEGNREIAGAGYATGTYGSFYLNAFPERYLYRPSDNAKITVQARDYDGHPIQTPFHAQLETWSWRKGDPKHAISSTDGRTDKDGNADVGFQIPSSGEFRVRVTTQTPERREIAADTYLWVPGSASRFGPQRERLSIVTDKKEYKAGDIAHAFVTVPATASHVLVTVEGSYLHSYQVAKNEGGSVTVDLPIKPEYAPNAFINASFIQDGKLYQGSKKLNVPPSEHTLNVELTPSKPQFKPGEAASYTLQAHDSSGKPVRGEFTFGVVDEAIYAIRPETVRSIVSDFYGSVYNEVQTQTSLTYYFSGSAGKRSMQLANLRPRNALAQLKPERLVQPKIRKAFPDTAYWLSDVKTDANGQAQIRFEFPDALTTWRATTRGITADSKVGSAVDKTIVRKNVMVRLVVPRFFREGDEVVVSTIVHNYLAAAKTARIQMEFDGLQVLDGGSKDIMVGSKEDAKVDWRVKVLNAKQARVLGKALTDEESDAMELNLPIEPFGVKLSEAHAGSVTGDGEERSELTFPAGINPASRSLDISLSSSVAGTIFGALEYLISYPYGCTEQTMSSFLPNVVVGRALKEVGFKSNVNPADLTKKVRAGLDRLYDYQHEDGAWGWWKTDDDSDFMTAYVISGLGQAREAGYQINEDALNRARTWLSKTTQPDKQINGDLRAYIAYALAISGPADANAISAAWEKKGDMSPYGLAVLGLALKQTNDSRVSEIVANLEKQAKEDNQQAWWESQHDWLLDFSGETSSEATAFAMKLLSAVNPKSPLLPKAAQYLVNHRDEGYYWTSTKQTAMVVFGLTDYIQQSGELSGDFTAQVFVNDKPVTSKHFTASDATSPAMTIPLTADQINSSNTVKVVKKGSGRLYWSAREQYYSTDKKVTNTGSLQLSTVREYFRLSPINKNGKIVYELQPLPDSLSIGDVLAVRITVGGNAWRYLMIEDPIPSGTESIQRDDLYELDSKPTWWSWWYTQRELHDNRTTFFQTYFSAGAHEYIYLLKVVNPGQFRVSPTKIEPMYQPQFFATSDTRTAVVK